MPIDDSTRIDPIATLSMTVASAFIGALKDCGIDIEAAYTDRLKASLHEAKASKNDYLAKNLEVFVLSLEVSQRLKEGEQGH